jgi:hypothetical protein
LSAGSDNMSTKWNMVNIWAIFNWLFYVSKGSFECCLAEIKNN